MPFDTICLFTGNQALKTAACSVNYVLRIFGWHPIPKKNVLFFECPRYFEEQEKADKTGDESGITHPWITVNLEDTKLRIHREGQYSDSIFYPNEKSKFPPRYTKSKRPKDNLCTFCGEKLTIHKRKTRIFRFASEVLPGDSATTENDIGGQSTEVKNAAYPEFKKWLPHFLIKTDINDRRRAITILDPNAGHYFGDIFYKGADIVAEFVGYQQKTQTGAGVQRLSCWADESCPYDFAEEQKPRLIAEDGDFLNSLTPAIKLGWEYEELFEKAQLYIKTKSVCDFLNDRNKDNSAKLIEWTDRDTNIVVIQASSFDNPTLNKQAIRKKLQYEDPETYAVRCYGIFKEITGKVFSDFDYRIHVINLRDYFEDEEMRFAA